MLLAGDNPLHCNGAGRRSAGESVVNPHSSLFYGECQDVVITAGLHGVLPE